MDYFYHILKALIIGFTTGLMISIPLGPAAIESVKRTLSKGLKAGLIVSFGAIAADVAYILIINLGLWNLLNKNKKHEALFWIVSGAFLIVINLFNVREKKQNLNLSCTDKIQDKFSCYGFLSGFIITFTNPLTPALWFTISSTTLKKWQRISSTCYYTFILSILLGMFVWFTMLNILALKGLKSISPKSTSKFTKLLNWVILGIGLVFIGKGFFKLFNLIV